MRSLARVHWLSTSVTTLIAALLMFSSQLEQVVSLDWARGILAVMDQLKYELLSLLAVGLFLPSIQRVFHKARAQFVAHWRTGHGLRLCLWSLTLVVGASIGMYQLAWYYIGKSEIYLVRYENKLLARAYDTFKDGNADHAREILTGCDYVLYSADCKTALERFDRRLARAETVYTDFEGEPYWSSVWLKVPGVIYEYDRRQARREDLFNRIKHFYSQTQADYATAVAAIEHEEWQRARRLLKDVSERFPWFGDAHIIVAEIDARQQSSDSTHTPYLAAMQRLGTEEFVRVMTNPWMLDLRSLQ